LPRLAQRHRLLARRRDFNLAIDEADDLVPRSRTAPEVGAANAGGDLRGADCDFALARLRHDIGGEAKGTLEDVERGLEELARRRELGEGERAVRAEPEDADVG